MPDTPSSRKNRRTIWWVSSTYFTEGLPYMVTRFLSSVFFTDMGVREAWLGFLNFLGLPWNFKFLWAPLLDIFGTKRGWLVKIQFLISLLVLAIAFLAGFHATPQSSFLLSLVAFLFVALAFLAATNDVAIDAYYLEGLTDKTEQAAYSGYRVMTYRVAVIFARSVLVGIAGVANWFWGFGVGALTLFAFFLLHRWFLPQFESGSSQRVMDQGPGTAEGEAYLVKRISPDEALHASRFTLHGGPATSHWSLVTGQWSELRRLFAESFVSYLKQEKVVWVLIFVATYKLGDEILFSMNTPFLMRELGVTKLQLSWIAGIIGAVATVGGTMLGAWWIKRVGLKKAIWPLTLLMNVNILAYLVLSEGRPQASTDMGVVLISIVYGYENIAAGLGSAALMVYLMRLCQPQFKAAHYAIGSAIMSLGSTFIGGFGGVIVEKMGYTNLFLLGFLAAIPSMLLLFKIPLHE